MRRNLTVTILAITMAVALGFAPGAIAQDQTPAAPAAAQEQKPAEQKAADQAVAKATQPENVVGTVDFGYRWLAESGSDQMYRTLVNYGEGPKLLGLHLSFRSPKPGLWDRFDVDSTSWGGEPYSALRIDVERAGLYRFNFQYRDVHFFSNVPTFANPLLPLNYLQSQNARDFNRRLFDVDLDLLPNKRIAPFFSYSRTARSGPGLYPWIGAGDEYLSNTIFDDSTDLFRAGTHLNFSRANFTIEGGGTRFADDQRVFLNGTNPGNRRTPLFGVNLNLNSVNQPYDISGNTFYARGSAAVRPFSFMDVSGQFAFTQPSTDVRFLELAAGLFAGPSALRSFTGQNSTAAASALRPQPSGSLSMELRPLRHVRIVQSYFTDRFHTAAGSLFTQTVTGQLGLLGNVLPATSTTTTPGFFFLASDYNRYQIEAIVELFPWLNVRGGYRKEWMDVTQIDPTPDDDPDLGKQRTSVALGGAEIRARKDLFVTFDTEVSVGDQTLVRTALFDYHKIKIGGRYRPKPWIQLNGKWTRLRNDNNRPDTQLYFRNSETTLGFTLTPRDGKRIMLSADWTYQLLAANTFIILPPFFTSGTSVYGQNGNYLNAYVNLSLVHGAKFNFGGSMLVSHGTLPTGYYQPRAELSVPLYKRVGWFSEWRYYDYSEKLYRFENFKAHLFSTGLRLTF